MQNSVCQSTRTVYETGFNAYCKYLLLSNIRYQREKEMPPVSEDLLIAFATHCFHTLKISYATIKLYICGIRFQSILQGVNNPFDKSMQRLQMLLTGIKRNTSNPSRIRLPITGAVLQSICKILNNSFFKNFCDIMMETVCIVAFFGFLRCSEFTTKDRFNHSSNLCLGDVSFTQSQYVEVTLKSSKTDPFRKGVTIKLFCNGHQICPFCKLQHYISVRKQVFSHLCAIHEPLFVDHYGNPLSRVVFIKLFKSILAAAGLPSEMYTGHSFRIGAATSSANARIEDHLIKTMGRWTSDSYLRYIKTPISSLQAAQISLAHTNFPL